MRLRRGIWLIRESTINFDNIQNVKVTQGPLQRFFGVASVLIETAGGGGNQTHPHGSSGTHSGLIEGVAEASEIRDSIMNQIGLGKSTGLGDEADQDSSAGLSAVHLKILRETRDAAMNAAASCAN
jgi:hypothetical protein